MASQAANSWTASEALSCPLWNEAPCAGHGMKALAIAPYLGDYLGQDENSQVVAGWGSSTSGLSKLFSELSSGGELPNGPSGGAIAQSFRWIEANKEVANSFGLSLVSYEGGNISLELVMLRTVHRLRISLQAQIVMSALAPFTAHILRDGMREGVDSSCISPISEVTQSMAHGGRWR